MNFLPIGALLLSIVSVFGGAYLEGVHMDQLIAPTAFMIVIGGTIGGTALASTMAEMKHMMKSLVRVIRPPKADRKKLLETMVHIASVVRRDGMLAVEAKLGEIDNDFMKRGLRMLVDGHSADDVAKVLELEIEIEQHHENAAGKVMETAGGFAPTVGILGAVLGLIHTMGNLADPSKLGAGIATAFVATIYGVGFANLLFLPLGNLIKKIAADEAETRNMILTGLEVIASGANPRQVEETLNPYVPGHHSKQEAA